MIHTDENNITVEDQFQTISYFSKNSPYRGNLLSNFVPLRDALIGTYGGPDFLSRSLCTYFMPRHPHFSQEVGGEVPLYVYGYKHVPGYEGGFEINQCPLYDFYKTENDKKLSNPSVQLIPGHPDALYSLQGEIYYAANAGPSLGTGPNGPDGGDGGGLGFLAGDISGCSNFIANSDFEAFFFVGIQNPLTEWPDTQEEKNADRCKYTNNAYAVKLKGHSNNELLPDNNVTKYFNACFPCRGFIDLPANGFGAATFTEYEDIGGNIKRMIVKAYTKEGNYRNHSLGSVLARMTIKDQIAQENIYYSDVAYFALNLIGSGIETLHTRETTRLEYYGDVGGQNGEYLGWNTIPQFVPPPTEYRARKLILTRGLHKSHGLTLDAADFGNDNFFIDEYQPRPQGYNYPGTGLNTTFSMENGGYIGAKGQLVSAFTDGLDAPSGDRYDNSTGIPSKVHGIFDINNILENKDLPTSDRNSKVNNSVGILRVHKDYELEPGLIVPSCREKFETLDGSLSDCNLPNNLVMSGLCWITTVFESDIWNAAGGPRSWAFGLEQTQAIPPNDPSVVFTSFETWLETTKVPSNILDSELNTFIASISVGINSAKTNNQLKYIGNGNQNVIPTPVTEILYTIQNNYGYIYNFSDFRLAAAKSKENDYACFEPNSSGVQYSCEETFDGCFIEGLGTLCQFYSEIRTLQGLEQLFTSINACADFIVDGKYTSVPEGECVAGLVAQINSRLTTDSFGCTISTQKVISLIEKFILSRINPCVFQYNNKIYRVMKEA
jgi:hypothetical protein